MSREIGGIAYDDKAALYPGAVYPAQEDPAYGSELLLIRKPEKGEREESGIGEQHAEGAGVLVDYDNVRQLEALAIAARIKQLKGSLQVMEKSTGELRPVRYSDMVILLRTTSGWDEEFKRYWNSRESLSTSHLRPDISGRWRCRSCCSFAGAGQSETGYPAVWRDAVRLWWIHPGRDRADPQWRGRAFQKTDDTV